MSVQVVIDQIDENCPVQVEGTINGVPFYFRARGKHWALHVGQDPLSDLSWVHFERYSDPNAKGRFDSDSDDGDPFAAGWMTEGEARALIMQGALLYSSALEASTVGGEG